ncbi:Origin of replication complex subunit 6 [Cymbomonas tetramitiformis]|uniref:Origin of replication complex subunit 6 n=1 Tax=Cymbomonas tetramitiformis TaxID=36881 RepID=A0AAE0L1C6_9CHLO|nr:Origin of replication complex subunit 6 [Cymbomonas tetramitiformis]
MDIANIQKRLGLLGSPGLSSKANELLRIANNKFPPSQGGLGPQAEISKPAICFELACGLLRVPVDRTQMVRFSGVTDKTFLTAFGALRNALGVKAVVDIRELAVQFGCARLVDTVSRVLTTFKDRYRRNLAPERRAHCDFQRPAFASAALYLCAKKAKVKVDRSKLLKTASVPDEDFVRTVESMRELCFDIVGIGESKVSKKRAAEDDDAVLEDAGGRVELVAEALELCGAHHQTASAANTDAYNKWKERVIAPSSSAVEKSAPSEEERLQCRVGIGGKLLRALLWAHERRAQKNAGGLEDGIGARKCLRCLHIALRGKHQDGSASIVSLDGMARVGFGTWMTESPCSTS